MTVTFCGHSQVMEPEKIANWLDKILPPLIAGGARTCYLGGYGNFDRLALDAVRRQKEQHPHIEAILVLAYLNRDMGDTSRYDDTTYPPLEMVPQRLAILKRNQWMVDQSDVVVSGVTLPFGGAAKTLAYAKRKHKSIVQYSNAAGA